MNRLPLRPRLPALLAPFLFALGTAAHAATADSTAALPGDAPPVVPSPITDHFAIRGTWSVATVATTGRVDPTTGTGTVFNAEQQLGLSPKAHQGLLELMFRLADRGRARIDFLDLPRQATVPLAQTQLQFGNSLYLQGDQVYTDLSWREMDFTWTYSFIRTEHFELGPGIGVHVIQAEALGQVVAKGLYEDYTAATPFGTLAVDGTWRIARRWALSARANYFRLHYNGDLAELGDYHADLQFRAWRNVAFGGGYDRRVVSLAVSNTSPSGEMLMTIRGPELFVRASF